MAHRAGEENGDRFDAVADAVWDLVDAAVSQLIRRRQTDQSADVDLDSFLPEAEFAAQRRVILELIKTDFEWRRKTDASVSIVDYLAKRPELEQDAEAVAELAEWEMELQPEGGTEAGLPAWIERYPAAADIIHGRLNNGDLQAASSRPGHAFSFSISTPVLESITRQSFFQTARGTFKACPPGYMFGRYRVLSVVGRGGMGVVYLCEDQELQRPVAVKVLHPWIINPTLDQSMIKREAQTAAQVRHESIVPIYDVGIADDGSHFFVMEYVEGKTLDQFLEENHPIPIDRVVQIVQEIAEGLESAHANGYVHRDIKPANILIDERGRARLTDFGLAVRDIEGESRNCSGTLPYMAPEQLNPSSGKNNPSDPQTASGKASDIWAVGVVLYELLTGQRPFQGTEAKTIADSIKNASPRAPKSLRSDIPEWLDQLCRRCLSKDPARRPASAGELARELGEGAAVRQPPLQRRWWIAAAVIGVGLLIAGLYSQFGGASKTGGQGVAYADDGICPYLRDNCGIVLELNTGRRIDPSKFPQDVSDLRNVLEQFRNKTNVDVFYRHFTAIRFPVSVSDPSGPLLEQYPGWFIWTVPVNSAYVRPAKEGSSTSYLAEPIVLSLYFAVHQDGRIQVGTFSNDPNEHLYGLLRGDRCTNYQVNAEYLPRDAFDEPRDATTHPGPENTALADAALIVYLVLRDLELFEESASTKPPPSFTGRDFRIVNYLGRPITVVDQFFAHELVRDAIRVTRGKHDFSPIEKTILDSMIARSRSALPAETRAAFYEVQQMAFRARYFGDPSRDPARNTWFPKPDDAQREFAHHELTLEFHMPEKMKGICAISDQVDNRNAARVTVSGLNTGRLPAPDNGLRGGAEEWKMRGVQGPTPDDISASSISVDPSRRELVMDAHNIAGVRAVLYDPQFSSIHAEALQQWSNFRVNIRFVVFGDWQDDWVTRSEVKATIHKVKPVDMSPDAPLQHVQLSAEWELLEQPVAMTDGPNPQPKIYGPKHLPVRHFTIPPSPRPLPPVPTSTSSE